MRTTFVILFTLLFCSTVYAEAQRYVSDVFYAPMRSGQGNDYRIINSGIRSGTKLIVVEEGARGEWTKVKTPDGQEGWMRSQYLQSEPVALSQLAQLKSEVNKLSRLKGENKRLTGALSKKALQERIHQALAKEHKILQTELEVLRAENERLTDNSKQTWFLYGTFSVGLGALMTLLLPLLRPRKRYSEWS